MNKFYTEAGIEVPSVTKEQMREIDRIAIEETGPNLFQMMENAGRNLAILAIKLLGRDWQKVEIMVLAGNGGNGGGICAARHLANHDAKVKLCLSTAAKLADVAAFQRKIFDNTNGQEVGFEDLEKEQPGLIIDALIGYGLQNAPRGSSKELIEWSTNSGAPILSLDVPSGVNATTGESPGVFVKPNWTMTLALPKTGLKPGVVGELSLADIGIPVEVYKKMNLEYQSPFRNDYVIPLKVHL